MKSKIGIIGFGNMGRAIAERINKKYDVFIYDKDKDKFKDISRVKVAKDNMDLVKQVEVVILAVKPQDFDALLSEIKMCASDKLVISIAAGISTFSIEEAVGKVRVIRAMPNLPAKIGKGVSCLCKGRFSSTQDLKFALRLFKLLGTTFVFAEDMMNATTAISGSGPGFWGYAMEDKPEKEWKDHSKNVFIPKFTKAAEDLGFSPREAKKLASATTWASLVTVQSCHISPAELKRQVASRGGTTEAGLEILEKGGSLDEAVKAALKRAEELSREE